MRLLRRVVDHLLKILFTRREPPFYDYPGCTYIAAYIILATMAFLVVKYLAINLWAWLNDPWTWR